jgi:hypothetical protein
MVEGIASFPERAAEWVALATRLARDESRTVPQRQVARCWAAIMSRVANGEDFIDVSRELDASNGGILYAPDGVEGAER